MIEIPLVTKQICFIDTDDFQKVSAYKWYWNNGYAYTHKKGETIAMHRLILNTPKGKFTDHINGNRLDNRKQNLRIATYQQNLWNKKKFGLYKGVTWDKQMKQWRVQITCDYKTRQIGLFKNPLHAAMAYDIAAKDLFGEFARLNFQPTI